MDGPLAGASARHRDRSSPAQPSLRSGTWSTTVLGDTRAHGRVAEGAEAPDDDAFYGFILDARQMPPAPENASEASLYGIDGIDDRECEFGHLAISRIAETVLADLEPPKDDERRCSGREWTGRRLERRRERERALDS